jgi:hypothetical protein
MENISRAMNINTVPRFVGLDHLSASLTYGACVIGVYKKISVKHFHFPIL